MAHSDKPGLERGLFSLEGWGTDFTSSLTVSQMHFRCVNTLKAVTPWVMGWVGEEVGGQVWNGCGETSAVLY